jgi:hypothetical protein
LQEILHLYPQSRLIILWLLAVAVAVPVQVAVAVLVAFDQQ